MRLKLDPIGNETIEETYRYIPKILKKIFLGYVADVERPTDTITLVWTWSRRQHTATADAPMWHDSTAPRMHNTREHVYKEYRE